MKNKKFMGTVGIVIAISFVLIILWLLFSSENAAAPNTRTNSNTSQQPADSGEPAASADSSNLLNLYFRDQDDILEDMLEDMYDVTEESAEGDFNGNVSEAFLEGMIPHHEASVDFSRSYLKYGGTNSSLQEIANNMISNYKNEIKQMEALKDRIEVSGTRDETKEKQYIDNYNKLLSDHQLALDDMPAITDVNHAFAESMILHSEMAVNMSKAILDYTDEKEVQSLAEKIIQTHEQQVQQLRNFLGR